MPDSHAIPKDDFPHLDHAPIVEAVFDIQARLKPDVQPEELEQKAREALRDTYPQVKQQHIRAHQIKHEPKKGAEFAVTEGLRGFQFSTPDAKQIVQMRRDGFSFNRLPRYGSFKEYLPEVKRCWAIYESVGQPVEVTRVALRYINRILLPLEAERLELDDFLAIGPRIPDEKDMLITGFLNRLQIREASTGLTATVITTIQPVEEGKVPVVLDIDAFQQGSFGPDFGEIWGLLQDLRGLKNRIFFGSLKEKCLGLLK